MQFDLSTADVVIILSILSAFIGYMLYAITYHPKTAK